MWLLRLLGVLTAISFAGGLAAYLLTRDARYLRFSWTVLRYAIFIALAFFALLILERVAIIPV